MSASPSPRVRSQCGGRAGVARNRRTPMIKKDGKTAADVRGRIQSGDDPAAAPMETDAEAASQPMSHKEIEADLYTRSRGAADRERDYDVAMREPGSARATPQTTRP